MARPLAIIFETGETSGMTAHLFDILVEADRGRRWISMSSTDWRQRRPAGHGLRGAPDGLARQPNLHDRGSRMRAPV